MRKTQTIFALVAMILAVALGATACNSKRATGAGGAASATSSPSTGTCTSTGTIHFAKTKFLLHAGLAFGAFHRYILKPYEAGSFASGASGRTRALIKAGAAGLFDVHEVKLAAQDASSDPTLCHLAAPFDALATGLTAIAAKFRSGGFNPSDLTLLSGSVDSLQQQAAGLGVKIKDHTVNL